LGATVRFAVVRASTVKPSVTSQPSMETGPRPHPTRRGPNHAFRPIRGEVRTVHYRAAPPLDTGCQAQPSRQMPVSERVRSSDPEKPTGGAECTDFAARCLGVREA
jgi:hypothetical protein